MVRKLFFIFGIIFLFSFVSSVTLNQGVVLNSSNSNSSINLSFSINVSNFTIEQNYILLYEINFTNSTGTYTCDDVNYSTINSILDSSEFNCIVVEEQLEDEIPSGRNGGIWVGIIEQENLEKGELKIIIGMEKDKELVREIKSSIMGIRQIKITAKETVYGNIVFKNLNNTLPENCNFEKNETQVIYEIFDINENFNISKIENITLKYGINNSWIQDKGISHIQAVKCYPYYELLKIEHTNKTELEDQYYLYSDSFSTWVIFGVKEDKPVKEDEPVKEKYISFQGRIIDIIKNESYFKISMYFVSGFLLTVILLIIFLLYKKKKRKIEKIDKKIEENKT